MMRVDRVGMCACKCVMIFSGIPPDFTEIELSSQHSTFFALYTKTLDWNAASLHCQSLHKDAHLVTITSDKKQQAADDFIRGRYTF